MLFLDWVLRIILLILTKLGDFTHLMLHIKQLLARHIRGILGAIGHGKILALNMREIFADCGESHH